MVIIHFQSLRCFTFMQTNFWKVNFNTFWAPGQQRRRMEGNEQKKKRMKVDPVVSRLSHSLRNYLELLASLKWEQVAATVIEEDANKDEWLIVKVIHIDRQTRELARRL